mgnify:CR=1 FL=1
MALSDESDKSDKWDESDDYDDALSDRIAPPVAAMAGAGLGSCYFAIFALFLK